MSTILRLRGLPFSCSEEEVVGFFEGAGEVVAVHLSTKNGARGGVGRSGRCHRARAAAARAQGRPRLRRGGRGARRPHVHPRCNCPSAGKRSGEGYAEFASPEHADKALKTKQHAHLSTRYIE